MIDRLQNYYGIAIRQIKNDLKNTLAAELPAYSLNRF